MAVRKQKRRKIPQKQLWRILPGVILILVAAGMLGLVVKVSLSQSDQHSSSDSSPSATGENRQTAYTMSDLIEQTRHIKGSPDAPVTILEFSDFQ